MKQLVSIIIPTYKRHLSIVKRAIESILVQTYKNWEIVLIDDSPSDCKYSNEIFNYLIELSCEKILYVRNIENFGGSISRNIGIGLSSGEYITFLDDDDEYKANKVEKQLEFMIKEKCDMSFGDMVMINESGRVVDYRTYGRVSDDNKKILKQHLMYHFTGTPTYMFLKLRLISIDGFPIVKLGQEFHLMLRCIDNNLKIKYHNFCGVIVHKHLDGGISQGTNKIIGEGSIFKLKKRYFSIFNIREKLYIYFRHYAVLGVARYRNHQNLLALLNFLVSFFCSPISFVKEILYKASSINKYKKYLNRENK